MEWRVGAGRGWIPARPRDDISEGPNTAPVKQRVVRSTRPGHARRRRWCTSTPKSREATGGGAAAEGVAGRRFRAGIDADWSYPPSACISALGRSVVAALRSSEYRSVRAPHTPATRSASSLSVAPERIGPLRSVPETANRQV